MVVPYVAAVLSFPGILSPKGALITRSNSVRPGIALMNAVPQNDSPDTSGTATFTFGTTSAAMNWSNALCDVGTVVKTSQGFVSRFVIFDRRWRWRKGIPVTGAYNVRDPSGSIISATQKTLQQLATILFTAFGESTADVSLITSTEYPMVVWDRDNPADELAELLEERGYVISMLANDTVKVYPAGAGATLPVNDDVVTVSISVDPPEVPDIIRAIGNRTYCQSMLKAIAVGKDTDGTIKPISMLSYSPGIGSTGWDGCDLVTFAYITDPNARDLAMETVGRWFQVVSQADGSQALSFGGVDYLPGEITVSDVSQLFPLKPYLLTTYTDQFSKKRYNEAFISGTFWGQLKGNPPILGNTAAFTRVDKSQWRLISPENGLIAFSAPALKDVSGTKVVADVYLTCSYSVHDATSMVKDRYERDQVLGGYGYDTFKIDELQRTLIASYTSGTSSVSGLTDNSSTVDVEADAFLESAALQYVTQVANVVKYRDCYPFSTDGVNLQVQWHIGMGDTMPFSTVVSQYAEALPYIPTNAEKQVNRAMRRIGSRTNQRNKRWAKGIYGKGATGFA